MDNQKFNQLLKSSSLSNMVVSGSTGTKVFASFDADNNFIQSSPSLEELKKKYITGDNDNQADNISINLENNEIVEDVEEEDVDMKIAKNESADADRDNDLQERTVIISSKEGVIGSRG